MDILNALMFASRIEDINADMLVRMQTEYNLQVARKNNKIISKLEEIRKIAAMLWYFETGRLGGQSFI